MKEECDWLWKTAVPALRQYCSEYHVTLELIDVNWRREQSLQQQQQQQPLLEHECSSSSERQAIIADCQQNSLGPDFVVILDLLSGAMTDMISNSVLG